MHFTDPRVKDWFLMQSYGPTLAITALYVMLVYAGKWWMADREPYKLKWAVFFYNIGLVILNFYIFSQVNFEIFGNCSNLLQLSLFMNKY